MPTKVKDKIVLAIFIFVILSSIFFKIAGPMIEEMIEKKRQLPSLYVHQNVAFDICTDYTQNDHYHGANELKLNIIIVYIYAYNDYQSKYNLTLDEVVDYFKEEYTSSRKLKVYSQPENIHDYIEWYYHGGEEKIWDYGNNFNDYMKKQGYPEHIYRKMEYKDVLAALDKYVSSPEYIPPKH